MTFLLGYGIFNINSVANMAEKPTFASDHTHSDNGSEPEIGHAEKPVVKFFVFGNALLSPDHADHKIPDSIHESVRKHQN